MRTLASTREQGWDVFFLPTREDAVPWAESHRRVTGREAEAFEEEHRCGEQSYTLFCVAVSPRPRPKVRLVTS